MRIGRALVRLSARLVPRDQRNAWREEWLSELHAAATRGPRAAVRFALGAPRDAWAARPRGRLFTALGADLRTAARQLVMRPGHTAAVVACLVVGLATSVAMWSLITSLFYGDMPGIAQRRALVRLYLSYDGASGAETTAAGRVLAVPYAVDDFRFVWPLPADSALTDLGAEGDVPVAVEGRHGPLTVDGGFASGGYFSMLRTAPIRGRLLDRADDRPEAPLVVVVTDHFWRTQLDAREDAIGQSILVGGVSAVVVGVTPPFFHGMEILDIGTDDSHGVQLWLPLAHAAAWPARPPFDQPWLTVTGRLRDGGTAAEVERQLMEPVARIESAAPSRRHAAAMVRPMGFGPTTTPSQVIALVGVLLALPMTVLAIGCANVANLQLARLGERTRDLAVRLSLGATSAQLLRLLTFETLARTLVAMGLAFVAIRVLLGRLQHFLQVFLTIDWRVLVFATVLTLLIALATGLAPAWLVLRPAASGHLKQSAQGGGLGHTRLRGALIASQVALSLALLILTGLFARTVQGMVAASPPALMHQVVATFDLGPLGLTPQQARAFAETLAERVARDSRVTAASLSMQTVVNYARAGAASPEARVALMVGLTPSWLDVMDVNVLTGRALIAHDGASAALISARLAHVVWPDASPLGDVLVLHDRSGLERRLTVVGVVADNPLRPTVAPPDPVIYVLFPPALEAPFTLRVRTASPEAVIPEVAALIHGIDPRVTWTSIGRGDRRFQDDAKEMGMAVYGSGAAGVVALLLSAMGLYAVMSYVVQLRRREIGIRTAIGADPRRIAALILRQALTLVVIGLVAGGAIGMPMAMFMQATFVARVQAFDPLVFGPPAALLLAVGLMASFVPAQRAARIDPISMLRQD